MTARDDNDMLCTLEDLVGTAERHSSATESDEALPGEWDDFPRIIQGTAASPGVGMGNIVPMLSPVRKLAECKQRMDSMAHFTLESFEEALRAGVQQLQVLQRRLKEFDSDVNAAMIFRAQLLILTDDAFTGRMRTLIREGRSVPAAVVEVVDSYAEILAASENVHLREKVHDVHDLGHRLLYNLSDPGKESTDVADRVVVAEALLPSDMVKLATEGVAGLVMLRGSVASHIAVLARSLGIPLVFSGAPCLFSLPADIFALVDGTRGRIVLHPTEEIVMRHAGGDDNRQTAAAASPAIASETRTADGVKIRLLANINLLHEVVPARDLGAEGIGLYRSEYPFIIRNECPTEDEQVSIYRSLYEQMEGRPVTLRTLDVGGDKIWARHRLPHEDNPFMGMRAIRFTLHHETIFREHLRAMLRAGAAHELRIMLPMVGSLDEVFRTRALLRECMEELDLRGFAFNAEPRLGIMVELPSAVELADELAREVDFLSLGTNDLVQYLLAVDRTNPMMRHHYMPHHPAVLRAMARVSRAARKHGKPLSLCGELARDEAMLPFLLGIGILEFSMDARSIATVQEHIGRLRLDECEALAARALTAATVRETARLLGVDEP